MFGLYLGSSIAILLAPPGGDRGGARLDRRAAVRAGRADLRGLERLARRPGAGSAAHDRGRGHRAARRDPATTDHNCRPRGADLDRARSGRVRPQSAADCDSAPALLGARSPLAGALLPRAHPGLAGRAHSIQLAREGAAQIPAAGPRPQDRGMGARAPELASRSPRRGRPAAGERQGGQCRGPERGERSQRRALHRAGSRQSATADRKRPPDPIILNGSIAENITYGNPGASREAIAAAVAGKENCVKSLPDGYGTRTRDEGSLLSGGERQRIAVGRALLGEPGMIILDEPTTHLDDQAVQRLLERILSGPHTSLRSSPMTIIWPPGFNGVRSCETGTSESPVPRGRRARRQRWERRR